MGVRDTLRCLLRGPTCPKESARNVAGRGLDDLARTAPKNRTAEQTRLLNELVQTRAAIGLVGTAIGDANRVAAALPDDAARVAAATSRLNVGDDLSRMSHQVREDVACDAAAGFLFPSERDARNAVAWQQYAEGILEKGNQDAAACRG